MKKLHTRHVKPKEMIEKAGYIPTVIGTSMFAGFLPLFPGTWGSIVGVAVFILIGNFTGIYFSLIIIGLLISAYISGLIEDALGIKDPSQIVIDETIGMMIALFGFQSPLFLAENNAGHFLTYWYIAAGFISFRFFDILKPWPISLIEKQKGGWAIMADDVAAGIITNILLQITNFILNKFF